MYAVFRTVAATVAGLLVASMLVIAVELLSAVVHPVPEGFGNTADEICRHVERYPQWVLAAVVPAWAATAFAAAWTARRLGNLVSLTIVGLLLLASLAFNVAMLPYPLWFKIANLMAIPAAIFAATILATRNNRPGRAMIDR